MATRPEQERNKLREMVYDAIQQGIIQPKDIMDWLNDNGWPYSLPSKMTIETVLKENGVIYVWGQWVKK